MDNGSVHDLTTVYQGLSKLRYRFYWSGNMNAMLLKESRNSTRESGVTFKAYHLRPVASSLATTFGQEVTPELDSINGMGRGVIRAEQPL